MILVPLSDRNNVIGLSCSCPSTGFHNLRLAYTLYMQLKHILLIMRIPDEMSFQQALHNRRTDQRYRIHLDNIFCVDIRSHIFLTLHKLRGNDLSICLGSWTTIWLLHRCWGNVYNIHCLPDPMSTKGTDGSIKVRPYPCRPVLPQRSLQKKEHWSYLRQMFT